MHLDFIFLLYWFIRKNTVAYDVNLGAILSSNMCRILMFKLCH